MPSPEQLPEDIRNLSFQNCVQLGSSTFKADVALLINVLDARDAIKTDMRSLKAHEAQSGARDKLIPSTDRQAADMDPVGGVMAFDVFISYPHQDKATADAACAKLEAEGIRCWIAPRDIAPSADWAASIVDAIDKCRVMILIFSGHTNRSRQVGREVQQAFDGEKPVVPFRIENVVPAGSFRYYMGSVHWLDALTPPLEQHLERLLVSVRALVKSTASDAEGQSEKMRRDALARRSKEQQRLDEEEGGRKREVAEAKRRADEEVRHRKADEDRQKREAEAERSRIAALEAKAHEEDLRQQRQAKVEEQRAEAERRRVEERRLREEEEVKRHAEAEDRPRPYSQSRPWWPPSRQVVVAGSLIVLLIAAVGAWFALPQSGPGVKTRDTFRECANCPVMKVVPAGSFTMGSPASEPGRSSDDFPEHRVVIARQFAVSQYELTFDEWDACVVDGGCNLRANYGDGGYRPSDEGWGRGRHPIISVSWNDASAYVAWLSRKTGKPYRLLSEAEYEYAARAGTTTTYPWGNAIGTNNANCDGCGEQWGGKQTAPVGTFAANAFGLYDMVGNVWEWTQDCYHDSFSAAPVDGSAWTNGNCGVRVMRGGSWYDKPESLRSASRDWMVALDRIRQVGFRVGRSLAP